MQSKQKVTLYLSPQLHRKLKIKAAIESEPMSSIAERAIVFYLNNPDLVDEFEVARGQSHRVYACPECSSPVVLKDGELESLVAQPGVLSEDSLELAGTVASDLGATCSEEGEGLLSCR
ncbi:MAG: hypothetical protein ACFBSC_09485 [Microcoleaceae cyanobacterium]